MNQPSHHFSAAGVPALFFVIGLSLAVLSIAAHGQTRVEPGIRVVEKGTDEQLLEPFETLDRRSITTGLLHDRVAGFVNPANFDGTAQSQISTYGSWRQAYHELMRSTIGAESPLPSKGTLDGQIERYRAQGVVPLAITNVRFQSLKPDAISSGLIVLRDGYLFENDDAATSPYEVKHTFSVAVCAKRLFGPVVQFIIPDELVVTHAAGAPRDFLVDFDDGGGFRAVAPGAVASVAYPAGGTKTIRLSATVDGQQRVAQTEVAVAEAAIPEPDMRWLDQIAARDYGGASAIYDAYVFLGLGNTTLTQPIVFVEGFDVYYDDPARRRTWQEIYEILAAQNFGPTLQAYGYDLVIFKLYNASDYVQRNAFALEDLLNKLNQEIRGLGKIVVVGPSMGGLIGRYGLAFMEKYDLPHNVRLFASLDAPHQGGNIPLGDQYFFEFFKGDSDLAQLAVTMLSTPAGRQMLIYQHNTFPSIDPLYTTLSQELAWLGYPSMRKVGISDGSALGLAQTGNERVGYRRMLPGDQIVEYRHRSFLVDLDGDVWAVPDQQPETRVFEGLKNVIGPHYRAREVYVQGTMPVDSAPGGNRGTQEEMTRNDPGYGTMYTSFPDHGWIPMVSALDLPTQNLYYNLVEDPENLVQINADGTRSTAIFNAIFAPDDNQPHVRASTDGVAFLHRQIDPTITAARVLISPSVFLEGPYTSMEMHARLNAVGILPNTHPYGGSPWHYEGDESVSESFMTHHTQVVDWVLLELRSGQGLSAEVIGRRAALLRQDGMIVDLSGSGAVSFPGVAPGGYYLRVSHRNHLSIMSAAPLALSSQPTSYDFTLVGNSAYGEDAMASLPDGRFGMRSGDADANGEVQNSDKNFGWTAHVGEGGYLSADFDLNGQVQNSDKNIYWSRSVGVGSQVPR